MNCLALMVLALVPLQAPTQDSEVDRLKKEVDKLKTDNAALLRQLEVHLAQLQESTRKPGGNVLPAVASPAPSPAAPPPVLREPIFTFKKAPGAEARVTAVANEIDLAVLSVGSEDGIYAGDEFVITRGGTFIARFKVDRTDRKWCAGKVSRKKDDPKVGDVATFTVLPAPPPEPARAVSPGAADELRSLRKELDEVRSQVRALTDRLVASAQKTGAALEEIPEELRVHLAIQRGLIVRRVREGSAAERAGLKANDVIPDLLEEQVVEAIDTGVPLWIVRQGQRTKLAGAKGK